MTHNPSCPYKDTSTPAIICFCSNKPQGEEKCKYQYHVPSCPSLKEEWDDLNCEEYSAIAKVAHPQDLTRCCDECMDYKNLKLDVACFKPNCPCHQEPELSEIIKNGLIGGEVEYKIDTTPTTEDWEKVFDEKYKAAYCVDCLRGTWKRDHIKDWIRAEIKKEKDLSITKAQEILEQIRDFAKARKMPEMIEFIDLIEGKNVVAA